jgi:hypothetical protein
MQSKKVGDVSPKHHVGDSRLVPVFGRKSDFKPFSNTNCRPNTGSKLPCGNVMFRRNITLWMVHHETHENYFSNPFV